MMCLEPRKQRRVARFQIGGPVAAEPKLHFSRPTRREWRLSTLPGRRTAELRILTAVISVDWLAAAPHPCLSFRRLVQIL
jgi:hypothetical protein